MPKRPLALARLRPVPQQFRWVEQRLVREPSMDHLRQEAGARSLLLVTVAAVRGRSSSADAARCPRLSMTGTALHQARQALIQRGLGAYQRPLSPVFALDADPSGAPSSASPEAVDDAPVDIQAMVARLWEV